MWNISISSPNDYGTGCCPMCVLSSLGEIPLPRLC